MTTKLRCILMFIVTISLLNSSVEVFAAQWETTRDSIQAAASNFDNWPNQNGFVKGRLNLENVLTNAGYVATGRSNFKTFTTDSIEVELLYHKSNLGAHASFLYIAGSSPRLAETDPVPHNFNHGDICTYDFTDYSNTQPIRQNSMYCVKNNFLIEVFCISDTLLLLNVLNTIITSIEALPDLNSIDDSPTKPNIYEIMYPDSLILEMATMNKRHEIKILINNPNDFITAAMSGTVRDNTFACFSSLGRKFPDEDTLRFWFRAPSWDNFTTDIDSLKLYFKILNNLGEKCDTSFWVTRVSQ